MNKQEQMLGLLQQAQVIVDGAKDRNLTDEEHEQATKLVADAMQVRDELKTDQRDVELKTALAQLLGDLQKGEPQPQPQQVKGTLGERFLADPAWQAWRKQVAPSGQFTSGRLGMSPAVMVGSFGLWGRKELITGLDSTSAGVFVVADQTGIYEQIGRYPTVLRDLISIRQTTSDVVEYVRQTAQVTQAAPTAEANVKYVTGATGEISGEKPQGTMAFERVSETVKTVAVYVGATKRALADAAQIRGIIDQELREDLV
ncbi:MAG TPA: phage major capsid protein, partial [Anaerolineae bacterium]|nr:phage major capsid protein [Anaerolineae bacterium]